MGHHRLSLLYELLAGDIERSRRNLSALERTKELLQDDHFSFSFLSPEMNDFRLSFFISSPAKVK